MTQFGTRWAEVSDDGTRLVVVDLAKEDRDERVLLTVGTEPVWFDEGKRAVMLYCESCLVHTGGRFMGACVSQEGFANLRRFKRLGILDFGSLPEGKPTKGGEMVTHWVTFTDIAWVIAHALRREQAEDAARCRLDQEAVAVPPMEAA